MPLTKYLMAVLLALGLSMGLNSAVQADDNQVKRLVLHVDENDPARMNLVLNNASNVAKYYQDKGDEVLIEVVAYGPGLTMLRADNSPVKDRVKIVAESYPDVVSFQACGNTHAKMSKKAGKTVELLPQAKMVPSGVVHLMERQMEGWAYVRP